MKEFQRRQYMQLKGLKEVKKGAKLLLKKEKIDAELKQLAREYIN